MHAAYLEAKRSIDDRSINRRVWDRMVDAAADFPGELLRIAEIGAGTGTMIDRFREWGFFHRLADVRTGITYEAWEMNPDTAAVLETRVRESGVFASSHVHVGDLRTRQSEERFDLVVANAVLDLFHPSDTVAILDDLVAEGGIVYASIVYDGVTSFEPTLDDDLDQAILHCYHGTMTQGYARKQLCALVGAGYRVMEAGGSDWIVPPRREGPLAAERELVSTILDMVHRSVSENIALCPDGHDDGSPVTMAALDRWIETRRRQLSEGELFFEAHQFDFFLRRP